MMLNDNFQMLLIVLLLVTLSTNTDGKEADGTNMDYTIHRIPQWKRNISTMFQWTITVLDLWGKTVAIATTVFLLWVLTKHTLRAALSYRDERRHQQ